MLGFGSAKFNQGTFGKGVIQSHGSIASTSTVNTVGIAQWEAGHSYTVATATVVMFGGLLKGGKSYMQGTSTMYSYPNFTWAGFGDLEVGSTTLTFGYIAWDKQNVSDTNWTTFQVD